MYNDLSFATYMGITRPVFKVDIENLRDKYEE